MFDGALDLNFLTSFIIIARDARGPESNAIASRWFCSVVDAEGA